MYSVFITVAVIRESELVAPEKVTKSPAKAPWSVSVTVTTAEPPVRAKGLVFIAEDALIGVTS